MWQTHTICVSFVQHMKQMFLFFPWCLALHWHPSVYSNRSDFNCIFTSVNGCQRSHSVSVPVVSRFGDEHKNKCSHEAADCSGHPLSLVTVSLFVLCGYLLPCCLAFAPINGCLFQGRRWPYAQHPLEKKTFCYACTNKSLDFLGEEWMRLF